jgi:hypothetical protein
MQPFCETCPIISTCQKKYTDPPKCPSRPALLTCKPRTHTQKEKGWLNYYLNNGRQHGTAY